jgi:hypothetical protein
MNFNYKKIALGVIRPVIPVYLHANNNLFGYEALIDSGADFNIFHAEIGRYLGLEIESGRPVKFGGIKGTTPALGYFHKVDLELGESKYKCEVAFSDQIANYGYGVLGQVGFFDHFRIEFNFKEELIKTTKI